MNKKIIRKLAIITFALITLFTFHKSVALIFLTWVSIFISISLYFLKAIKRYSAIYGKDKALVAEKISDLVSNISVIRMFSSQRRKHQYIKQFLE